MLISRSTVKLHGGDTAMRHRIRASNHTSDGNPISRGKNGKSSAIDLPNDSRAVLKASPYG
jgi:hypothetical protein